MTILKKIKEIIPLCVKEKVWDLRHLSQKRKILKYLSNNLKYEKEYLFLKNNRLSPYLYEYTKNYNWKEVDIKFDNDERPFYLYKNKRMYLKKSMKVEHIKKYVSGILQQEDINSPHKYNTQRIINNYNIQYVADIGAAEGFFALDVIDYVKKVYIFECDGEWAEALEKTFSPYTEKIEIIKKYVGGEDKEENITLDRFFENLPLDCIKADIEGAEVSMLNRGGQTLKKILLAIICTYHRQNDAKDIYNILQKEGFKTSFTPGYILFLYDKELGEPWLRRGVITGEK